MPSDNERPPYYYTDSEEEHDGFYGDGAESKSKTTTPLVSTGAVLNSAQPNWNPSGALEADQFWPASSQIALSKYEPNPSLYDSKIFGKPSISVSSSGLYLDESTGELKNSSQPRQAVGNQYEKHAREQTEETTEALKMLDADGYLKLPTAGQNSTSKSNLKVEPGRKDILFKYLYILYMVCMMLVGILVTITHPTDIKDGLLNSPTLYRVIMDSARPFISVLGLSLVLSGIWILLMQYFTSPVIYAMISALPVCFGAVSFWALIEILRGSNSWLGSFYLYTIIGISGFSAVILTSIIKSKQKTINSTIAIAKTSSQVLSSNPSIFTTSLVLLIGYVAFLAVWLFFFAHLLLLGSVESISSAGSSSFHLSKWSYWLQFGFLFGLVWTSSNLANLQKAFVSEVVSKWYFEKQTSSDAFAVLGKVYNSYSGQICFGGLIISFVRSIRLSFQIIRKAQATIQNTWIQKGFSGVHSIMQIIERLLDHVTGFTIYYVPLSGESFCKSGRSVLRLLKRNALLSFTTDSISKLIFNGSVLIVSSIAGLSSYAWACHSLHSSYGWFTGIIYGSLAWCILKMFSGIYSTTMDVTFLCYAIDLDSDKITDPLIHQAFVDYETEPS